MVPFVSIIVATYRREDLLRSTLQQLLDQDYPRYEPIVADQSSDHEQETSDFLIQNAARIRYFRLEQPNLPAARNFAIQRAAGDIIAFVDDDMIVPRDCVSKLVEAYRNEEVWGATGFTLGHAEADERNQRAHEKRVASGRTSVNELIRVKHFNGCLMSFRREIFERVGYFDEWMGSQPMAAGEDSEFCYRATSAGLGLWLNPALVTQHLVGKRGGCGRRELDSTRVHDH